MTIEARVPTDRASRYLVQFCRHAGQMGRMRHRPPTRHQGKQVPPTVQHADWSDTAGTVRFAQGCCTLTAESDSLTVRIDAEDEDALRQLQDGITRRLETMGRRDDLAVRWHRPDPAPELQPVDPTSPGTRQPRRHRGRLSTLGVLAVAVVAVLAHVGLLGGALAASIWGTWGLNAVIAIILVKVIVLALHVLGGRFALRRGKTVTRWLPSRWKVRHTPHPPVIGHAVGSTTHDGDS